MTGPAAKPKTKRVVAHVTVDGATSDSRATSVVQAPNTALEKITANVMAPRFATYFHFLHCGVLTGFRGSSGPSSSTRLSLPCGTWLCDERRGVFSEGRWWLFIS